jgi:hypothetical protein
MKILIDIPEAFEADYNADRFADFFQRCIADMGTCCGNFELETAVMMEKAFAESRLYDPDKVTEQLKYNITLFIDKDGEKVLLYDAIEIVKAGGNADLLIDRAKSKSGERIPYDGKWK